LFELATFEDVVKLPPRRFGEELEKALLNELREKYEGKIIDDGVLLFVIKVYDITGGEIPINDGFPKYKLKFDALMFRVSSKEIFNAEITKIERFGMFVNLGGLEGLVHISQISGKKLKIDDKNQVIQSEDSTETYRVGDKVRVKVIAASFGPSTGSTKIACTLRQPGLGKIE